MVNLRALLKMIDSTKLARIGFAIAFIGMFFITGHLLLDDKSTSATVGAVLTLSLGLFCFLPTLESFAAFGLSAQFKKELDEAGRLLALIRQSISVSSRHLAMSLAWSNRLGDQGWEVKMSQMAELNEIMIATEISAERIKQIRSPFISIVNFDLFYAYYGRALDVTLKSKEVIDQRLASIEDTPENVTERSELLERSSHLGRQDFDNLAHQSSDEILSVASTERRRLAKLDDRDFTIVDKEKFDAIGAQCCKLIAECRDVGNITPEAIAFLEKHQPDYSTY